MRNLRTSLARLSKNGSQKRHIGLAHYVERKGHHDQHIHQKLLLSGVIYLKVVPSLDKNEGGIIFTLTSSTESDGSRVTVLSLHNPEGDMILFTVSVLAESFLSTDTDRIVVSFDFKAVDNNTR